MNIGTYTLDLFSKVITICSNLQSFFTQSIGSIQTDIEFINSIIALLPNWVSNLTFGSVIAGSGIFFLIVYSIFVR